MFTRLNGRRLAASKSALCFINPFIYENPPGFQDVTHGCNKDQSKYGFTDVKGWGPATGFGTPGYEAPDGLVMASSGSFEVIA